MTIETLRPNAEGDECTITLQNSIPCPNHYQEVNEVAQDGYGTFVKEDLDAYHRDLYNMENSSVGEGIINSVKQIMWVWHEGGRDRIVFKHCVKTGGAVHEFNGAPTGGIPVEFTHTWNVNPETTDPWTWAEIDLLQVGVALRDPLTAGGTNSRCTQIYIEVDYTPTRTFGLDVYFAQIFRPFTIDLNKRRMIIDLSKRRMIIEVVRE